MLDVTGSAFLYGPRKPRWCYAGRAVSRASALGITCQVKKEGAAGAGAAAESEADVLAVRAAISDDMTGLGEKEWAILRKRVGFFLERFPKVGSMEGVALVMPA